MKRRLNLRDCSNRRSLQTSCRANFFDHLFKHAARIVALAKEAPVQRIEPLNAFPVNDRRSSCESEVNPSPALHDAGERLLTVSGEIRYQYDTESGNQSQHGAASQCILKTLPDDDLDIEDPVSKDGVS